MQQLGCLSSYDACVHSLVEGRENMEQAGLRVPREHVGRGQHLVEGSNRIRLGRAAASGDEDAIEALCSCCRGAVQAEVMKLTKGSVCSGEQEDIVQEGLMKAVELFSTFRSESDPCTWMVGVARNVTRNYLRSATRRTAPVLALSESGLVDVRTHAGSNSHIGLIALRDWLLRNLAGEYRQTFDLYYRQGLSYREIADRQYISVDTVGSRLNRIRQAVRQALEVCES